MEALSDVELLDRLRGLVQRARHLDTKQGAKMLYSDLASLSNRVWTVGLNPGGSHWEPDQWHREDGAHDYRDGYLNQGTAVVRPGGLKLRRQLAAMMRWLGLEWSETLSLNLVPFRCAKWSEQDLPWRQNAIAFAKDEFWPALLENRIPRLVLAFGNDAAAVLRRLLGHTAIRRYSTGWGTVTADVSGDDRTTLLRLPHLSTFGIFERRSGVGRAELEALRRDPSLERALHELRGSSKADAT